MSRAKELPVRFWVGVDYLLAAAAFTLAARVSMDVELDLFLLYEGGLASIALIAITIVGAASVYGLYTFSRFRSRVVLFFDLTAVIGFAFLLQAVIHYIDRDFAAPLPVVLIGSAFAQLAMFAWRLLAVRSFGPERVLMAGATPMNRRIAAAIAAHPRGGMAVAGFLDDELPRHAVLDGVPVLGAVCDLPRVYGELAPHRVVIDCEGAEDRLDPALVKHIVAGGLVVEKPAALYEALFGRMPAAQLQAASPFLGRELAPRPALVAMQAVYNNVIGLAALVAAAPLMAVLAMAIKLTSAGPVLVKRRALGWNLIPFTLLDFRCADSGGAPTRLGSWLRRLRLDRLPRMWNVVRGEMSLAGPRPALAADAEALMDSLPCYRLRFTVKPGVAGWSRIHMRPGDGDAAELEYDLYYVKHLSVALDCSILLSTLEAIFSRSGEGAAAAARHG